MPVKLEPDGGWKARCVEDQKFRDLTPQEVVDLQRHAESHTPPFANRDVTVQHGPVKFTVEEHNAPLEDHHPVARAVWEAKK